MPHVITLGLEVRPPSPIFKCLNCSFRGTLPKTAVAGILSPQKYVQRIQRFHVSGGYHLRKGGVGAFERYPLLMAPENAPTYVLFIYR